MPNLSATFGALGWTGAEHDRGNQVVAAYVSQLLCSGLRRAWCSDLQARTSFVWDPMHSGETSLLAYLLKVDMHLCLIEFSSFQKYIFVLLPRGIQVMGAFLIKPISK